MSGLSTLKRDIEEIAIFRDEGYSEDIGEYPDSKVVRDAIWDFIEIKPEYLTIIDSPFLQRLRYISQTAFASSTYPSSLHTRFEHTLGVFHCTKKFLEAIETNEGEKIHEPHRTEAILAALLHDIGHGPFSHTSENVYRHYDVFDVKSDRFENAEPSEILSHCLIESSPIQRILEEFVKQSDEVDEIDSSNISDMIIGNEGGLPQGYGFLRDVINGPFDTDKFDYINRDGYFTGLNITLDTNRILQGLELANDKSTIYVNHKSLGALEQVFIAKSQLYSRVYHHHKIRAAATLAQRLFRNLQDLEVQPIGDLDFDFSNPATYLLVDDSRILGKSIQNEEVSRLVDLIKRRELPRRALVISHSSLPAAQEGQGSREDVRLRSRWGRLENELGRNPRRIELEESRISELTPAQGAVYIDIPPELPGDFSKARPQIKLGRGRGEIRDMSEVFPADSWAHTYETYRQRNYIFTDADREEISKFADGTLRWLDEKDIKVKKVSVHDAKVPLDSIDWSEFLD